MDVDDENTPAITPPEGAPPSLTPQHASEEQRSRQKNVKRRKAVVTSSHSPSIPRPLEGEIIPIRNARKEPSQRKAEAETIPPESSAGIQKPEEEEASAMAEMDARSPEEKLTEWLLQMFEILKLRNSTGRVAQVETCPVLEDVVSPETHMSSKGKDSIMAEVYAGLHEEEEELPDWMSQLFRKLDMELNEDSGCSTGEVSPVETHPRLEHGTTGEVSPVETHPRLEHGISSEIRSPSKLLTKVDRDSHAEDEYIAWMFKMVKMGGNDDMSHLFVDLEEKHAVNCDQPDDYDLMDEDFPKSMKKFSYSETIENGFKWMSEECFVAFTKYAENINVEGIEYRFGEIRRQCFSVEAYDKTFHHSNFTIEAKHKGSDVWASKLYFAEVKQVSGIKCYFFYPLEPSDKGHCNGCKSQDVDDLQHPSGGGYMEGDADIYWPFETDTDCDSDSSDDGYLRSVPV